MPLFKRGFDYEDRIVTQLERVGFKIDRNPVLDHKWKLDFIIMSFPDGLSYNAIGVQVTTHLDNAEKIAEFLSAPRKVDKSLYLEIADSVDLESGGAMMITAAITNYEFNEAYREAPVLGARILSTTAYGYFDLPARLSHLRRTTETQPVPQPGSPLRLVSGAGAALAPDTDEITDGVLEAFYTEKRFGFIQGPETFFYYIDNVADPELRRELEALPVAPSCTYIEMPVTFVNAGRTRPNAKYPEARNVRRRA